MRLHHRQNRSFRNFFPQPAIRIALIETALEMVYKLFDYKDSSAKVAPKLPRPANVTFRNWIFLFPADAFMPELQPSVEQKLLGGTFIVSVAINSFIFYLVGRFISNVVRLRANMKFNGATYNGMHPTANSGLSPARRRACFVECAAGDGGR